MEIFKNNKFIQNSLKNSIALKILSATSFVYTCIFLIRIMLSLIINCALVSAQHCVAPGSFSEHIYPLKPLKKGISLRV